MLVQIILLVLVSIASFLWIGPWLSVLLLGGKGFLAVAAVVAVVLVVFHLWLWLIPVALAVLGSMIAADGVRRRYGGIG